MELFAFWRLSLVLIAFVIAGTAPVVTLAVSVDITAVAAATIKADVAQIVAEVSMLMMLSRYRVMMPRILSLWNAVVLQP